VSFFADLAAAHAANNLLSEWTKISIADLYDGEPEVMSAQVFYSVWMAAGPRCPWAHHTR
jgi:hypothetical protein